MAKPVVVLYNPRAPYLTMPLGLIAIGSALDRAAVDVVIVDGRLERDPVAVIAPLLPRALCLGVSVLTGAPIADALRVSRAVKARAPGLPVIWGGWHPSLFPADCLAEPAVDVTVQAQGEATFAAIVAALAAGARPADLVGVAGCTVRRGDGGGGGSGREAGDGGSGGDGGDGAGGERAGLIHHNAPRALIAAETLPAHDYGLIDVPAFFGRKGRRQLDYITSYGCHFRCDFCADPFVYGRRWTGLSPQRVTAELDGLWRRYGFDDVNFQDETLFTHAERITAMAEGFLRLGHGFSWAGTLRADQAARMSDAELAHCRRAGLRRVLVGVESGSQAMLDWMHKDIRLDQVLDTAARCKGLGIAVQFPFIVGFPGESAASVDATLALAARLRLMSPTFETPVFYFKPYPGSAITVAAVRDGHALPATLAEWAAFDLDAGTGPWVAPRTFRRTERYKHYASLAWRVRPPWRRPVAAVARWRLRRGGTGRRWRRGGAPGYARRWRCGRRAEVGRL